MQRLPMKHLRSLHFYFLIIPSFNNSIIHSLIPKFPPKAKTTPPSTTPEDLSRRDAILLGVGGGATALLYGKLLTKAISQIASGDIRPKEHEERVASTFRSTISNAFAYHRTEDPFRILEIGIGGKCRSIVRGLYDPAMEDIAAAFQKGGGATSSTTKGIHFIGVDANDLPNADIKNQAQKTLQRSFQDNIQLPVTFETVQGDVCASLPYPDGTFHAITCYFTLCSVQDPEKAIYEIKRLLKPRGGAFGWVEHVAVTPEAAKNNDKYYELLDLEQRVLDPLQQLVAQNCHLHRYTDRSIFDGFGVEEGKSMVLQQERFFADDMWPVTCQNCGVVLTV